MKDRPSVLLVDRIKQPFANFLGQDFAGGVILIIATLVALIWANSSFSESYFSILKFPISIKLGDIELANPLAYWVKDVLMTIFFFLVGLEIKKELAIGHLSKPSKAALPMIAALGGMVVPAALFFWINAGTEFSAGWGIPMATDIAFAVGVLTLFGKSVPMALRIFLLALAIVDDLGAVMVIAFLYSSGVSAEYLMAAAAGLFVVAMMNQIGIRNIFLYVIVGVFVWYFFRQSGIHSTMAGVILGLMTPFYRIEEEDQAPLDRLAHSVHPWVTYFIMPVFALTSAGVVLKDFQLSQLFGHPVSLGVIVGLFVGKPLGIFLFSYAACKLKIASLPEGVSWPQIGSVGFLAGIGFTMSIFVSALAFKGSAVVDISKVGIFAGSLFSGIAGYLILSYLKKK
ncbi:MAG: Na+/H+ antiporter NhaA [Nitrosomonas ureae]